MTTSYRSLSRLVLIGIVTLLFAACSAFTPGPDNSVNTLMPKLDSAYTITDITQYQGELTTLISAGGVATGQPQVVAAAEAIGKLADCYKTAGAYAASLYVSKTNVLNTGVAVLINKTVALNPATLLSCVSQSKKPNAAANPDDPILSPCAKVYEFKYNNKDFVALIGATNGPVCADLCNALPDSATCNASGTK
jgi:hypothetical protein